MFLVKYDFPSQSTDLGEDDDVIPIIKTENIVLVDDDDDEEKKIILKMEDDDYEELKIEKSEPIDIQRLEADFRSCILYQSLKKQSVYLSHQDTEISFDEGRHIYLLHNKAKEFGISVTGFCKKEIHNSEFNGPKLIRNMVINIEEDEYDMHVYKAIEWKYAALFGSLFHAIVEYFFENIVNGCTHPRCKQQQYNIDAYTDSRLDDTHQYFLSIGKCSQSIFPSEKFPPKPKMPCCNTLLYFDDFVDTILRYENFQEFFNNNHRFNINSHTHKRDILKTMEQAFFVNRMPLSQGVLKYRRVFANVPFETSIDNIVYNKFGIGTYIHDLRCHLQSFRNVLFHLPLKECCDIRPEYIVFNENHGLAGSVDLTMRLRADPNTLFIYDWKTCKKIFSSFRRNNEQTSQLFDYACQLHTYANLIQLPTPKYNISLFVVNITHTDSCVYNVKSHRICTCREIFSRFRKPLVSNTL